MRIQAKYSHKLCVLPTQPRTVNGVTLIEDETGGHGVDLSFEDSKGRIWDSKEWDFSEAQLAKVKAAIDKKIAAHDPNYEYVDDTVIGEAAGGVKVKSGARGLSDVQK
jgi:hypothetical protein